MKILFITLLSFIILSGCANSYSEGNLRRLTSRSTGLAEHEFIIGNRKNNISSISYDIKNKSNNDIYHCTTVFAPISGGVTTMPNCVDKFGIKLEAPTSEVTF